jgi:hypothetical protein
MHGIVTIKEHEKESRKRNHKAVEELKSANYAKIIC